VIPEKPDIGVGPHCPHHLPRPERETFQPRPDQDMRLFLKKKKFLINYISSQKAVLISEAPKEL
jgi:hypothetical protein